MADVGCAGILVADTFCGPMKRLPLEGELLAIDEMPSKAGGCAANVAIDLVKQRITAEVCGCVGADPSAEVLLQSLRTAGVGCGQIQRVDGHPTSKTVILLVEEQDRRYIHIFGANAAFDVRRIRRDWIDRLKVFYLGGLFAMPSVCTDELAELLAYCRQRGVVTVVDVVVPQDRAGMEDLGPLLPQIDYFLPNDDEARRLTGIADPPCQAEALLRLGARTVIITCGPDGSFAARGATVGEPTRTRPIRSIPRDRATPSRPASSPGSCAVGTCPRPCATPPRWVHRQPRPSAPPTACSRPSKHGLSSPSARRGWIISRRRHEMRFEMNMGSAARVGVPALAGNGRRSKKEKPPEGGTPTAPENGAVPFARRSPCDCGTGWQSVLRPA